MAVGDEPLVAVESAGLIETPEPPTGVEAGEDVEGPDGRAASRVPRNGEALTI